MYYIEDDVIDLTIVCDSANPKLLQDEASFHSINHHIRLWDLAAWNLSYYHGYREPNYPVPAHRYITLITPHTVEMVKGITREYDNGEIYYDCECVFFLCNYPKEVQCRSD